MRAVKTDYEIQQLLRICTGITQFFISKHVLHKYSHITQILQQIRTGPAMAWAHIFAATLLWEWDIMVFAEGPLIGIVPLALHPKLVCNLWGLCTAIQVDDVAPFQNLRCCMYDEMDLTSAHDVNPLAVGEGEQLCALIHEGRAQGVK